ncbi:MAG: hypothetical protein WC718_03220 [Phycisphaerales bacterium]|jgi:hypothetical protein
MRPMIKARIQSAAIALAVLAFVWWYLGLHPVLGGSIAGVIVLSHLLPAKWDEIGSGVGFAIIAGVVYFYFHQDRVAALLGAVAAFYIFAGVRAFPRGSPAS